MKGCMACELMDGTREVPGGMVACKIRPGLPCSVRLSDTVLAAVHEPHVVRFSRR